MKYLLFIFIFILVGCKNLYTGINNSDILDAKLKISKVDSCKYNCYKIELYLKNNSSDKIYVTSKGVSIYNCFGLLLSQQDKRRLPHKKFSIPYSYIYEKRETQENIKAMTPNETFMNDAEKQELILFCKHNDIDISDTTAIKDNIESVSIKYNKHSFYFLDPYEEVKINFPDLILYKKNKIKITWIRNYMESDQVIYYYKYKLPDGRNVERINTYLNEVAGYKLFYGKIKSNTFVIRNGTIIKEKPAPDVKKKKSNKKNDK